MESILCFSFDIRQWKAYRYNPFAMMYVAWKAYCLTGDERFRDVLVAIHMRQVREQSKQRQKMEAGGG